VVPHDFNTDTVTSLTLSAGSIALDQEPSLTAHFSVVFKNHKDALGNPIPVSSGLVDLRTTLNGRQIDLCSSVALSAVGTAICHLTAEELPVGSYQIIGHFEGVLTVSNHSDSGSVPLTVTRAAVNGSLTTTVPQVAFGQENAEGFHLTVTSGTSELPSGQFSVGLAGVSGGTLCGNSLVNGLGFCDLAGTQLNPGSYKVEAGYGGDSTHGGLVTGAQNITVTKGTAVTTLSLSASPVSFGQQQNEKLTVRVAAVHAGSPTGQVTVKEGDANICGATLADGIITCQLNPSQLTVGKHSLTASYSGDTDFDGSISTPQTLTVTAPTTTALSLSKTRVKVGREQAEILTVTVKSTISGTGTPGGNVTIKAGTMTVCRAITLHSGKARCTLSARQLRRGTYHLTARYAGATLFTASTSQRKTLTVTR
jgi:large repetitive protein